jgi:hypothetical protein
VYVVNFNHTAAWCRVVSVVAADEMVEIADSYLYDAARVAHECRTKHYPRA